VTVREFALDTPSLLGADPFWAETTARLVLHVVVERLERIPALQVDLNEATVRVGRADRGEALGDIPHGMLLKLTVLDRQGRLLVPLRDLPETLASMRPPEALRTVRKALRKTHGVALLERYLQARLDGDVGEARRCKQDLRDHLAAVEGKIAHQVLARRIPPDLGDDLLPS
jgi:hypothetical protein